MTFLTPLDLQGLENRLKYSQKDLESSTKSIQSYEKKLQDLEAELNAVSVRRKAD